MTEAETTPSAPPEDAAPKARAPRSGAKMFSCVLISILVLAVALAGAWHYCPWLQKLYAQGGTTPDLTEVRQRLLAVEQHIQTLDGKVTELGAQVEKNASASATVEPFGLQEKSASVAALTRVQSDLAALSSTVSDLGDKVKETGTAAAQTQQATQAALAAAIAFIQLREAAMSGRGFEPELTALRNASGKDAGFQESLGRLEPYAAKGAPALHTLREEFVGLEASASAAVEKASAQTWWERALAELKGLVSIRPLHGHVTGDIFATAETALSSDDLPAALVAADGLPAEAKETLKGWRETAEARQAIDAALRALAGHFVTFASPANPQGAP